MKHPFLPLAKWLVAAAFLASTGAVFAAQPDTSHDAPREAITPAFAHAIANVPGKKLTALIVDYAPGGSTPAHRHGSAFVVGYVLEGSIRSRLGNGKEQVFQTGESWTELPSTHHAVSDNASKTKPAKLLAIFIADSEESDLLTVDKK